MWPLFPVMLPTFGEFNPPSQLPTKLTSARITASAGETSPP